MHIHTHSLSLSLFDVRTLQTFSLTHLLQVARDGALHGPVPLQCLEPALALRKVLEPRELCIV